MACTAELYLQILPLTSSNILGSSPIIVSGMGLGFPELEIMLYPGLQRVH